MDMRELNKAAETGAYPLPLQPDVIAAIKGATHTSVVDGKDWFHQFLVHENDRHKLTIRSYRGQERNRVTLMGFKNCTTHT